jgi:16S rRNA (guanine527-N7)-methyltransferase
MAAASGYGPAIPRGISPGERAVVRAVARAAALSPPEGGSLDAEVARIENLFRLYLEEILGWTRDSNLVARGDLGRLASRHLAESIAVLPVLDRLAAHSLVDLGSGAGFPAIPIQIARPELRVTLVESRRRKGLFLARVVQALELSQAEVLIERAEHLAEEGAESIGPFDVGTARAVAPAAELLSWLAPLVRPGGHAVLFKGSSYAEELRAWENSPESPGGPQHWKQLDVVPVADRHLYLVVLERLGSPV